MEKEFSQINYLFTPDQMERLKRNGCGVINCRSRLGRGSLVSEEIRKILDSRSCPACLSSRE